MDNESKKLLLYIAAKVAKIDATCSVTHAILRQELAPEDSALAAARDRVLSDLVANTLRGEMGNLRIQFPDTHAMIQEYLEMSEREIRETHDEWIDRNGEGPPNSSDTSDRNS